MVFDVPLRVDVAVTIPDCVLAWIVYWPASCGRTLVKEIPVWSTVILSWSFIILPFLRQRKMEGGVGAV